MSREPDEVPVADLVDVYIPVDRLAALVPAAESIVNSGSPPVTVIVPVFWPQGLRGTMTLTVDARTARRMHRHAVLMSATLRRVLGTLAGVWLISGIALLAWVGRSAWPCPALGLAVPVLFAAATFMTRLPQYPIDRGEGWVVLRHADPVTAHHWQHRNPTAGMVIEPVSRQPQPRPSTGQHWWQSSGGG